MMCALRFGWVLVPLIALSLFASGCGFDSDVAGAMGMTAVDINALMRNSSGVDTDGDGVPDDVETYPGIGTDPNNEDTDGDGVIDGFEIFGRNFLYFVTGGRAGELQEDDVLLDENDNGVIAPLDPTETCEMYQHDADGDGVLDYLEVYGYVYDWVNGRFAAWTHAMRSARPDVPWYQTDPLQPSTDQDAYPDGMEASGLLMDVAVQDPGRHPLVPALPNIVVKLAGYQVTLNDEITYEEGGSVAKGYSWTRETASTRSTTHSVSAEVGFETGYDGGFVAKGHITLGWGMEIGHTTSSSYAVGGTVDEEINWNRARSHNPTQAAVLKLSLKVENHGTAPVSNVVPTLNLSIGGANITTFKPSNLQVNLLMPGETFPAGENNYWVFDTTENGPLYLTDWELRALESGAPVQIAVSQVDADVMRLNDDSAWESAGEIGEYMKRCEAVCATLFADLGDGDFMHHRVFAGEGVTAPVVTLRDALRWTMGATEEGDDVFIEQTLADGSTQKVKLTEVGGEGWSVHMDRMSYERLEPGEDLLDLRLQSDSHIELVSPREVSDTGPTIFSAYAVPLDGGHHVVACVYDYDGIDSVVFVDQHGQEHEMARDGRGPWFYSVNLPDTYLFAESGAEFVRVISVNATVSTAALDVEIIHTVISLPPSVGQLVYDESELKLRATVVPGTELPQDAIKEGGVRLFHYALIPDGYLEMKPVANWFEAPNVYECRLSMKLKHYPNARVVAESAGGQYTAVSIVDVVTVTPFGYGDVHLETYTHWDVIVKQMIVPFAGLDYPSLGWVDPWYGESSDGTFHAINHTDAIERSSKWPSDELAPLSTYTTYEFYIRSKCESKHATRHYLGFMPGCIGAQLTPPAGTSAEVFYEELTRSDAIAQSGAFENGVPHSVGSGQVYAFFTRNGRYGKLFVKEVDTKLGRFLFFPLWTKSTLDGRFVIFSVPPLPPTGLSYTDMTPTYPVNVAITNNVPSVTGVADDYTVSPALPAGLSLDPVTGVISGSPTVVTPPTAYEVTASNTTGASTMATLTIQIEPPPPSGLSFPDLAYTVNVAQPSHSPTVTGVVDSYSLSPALPAGLSFDSNTGDVSGTPTVTMTTTTYTLTATNAGGSTTTTFTITVDP